jgi:hypothetical protein
MAGVNLLCRNMYLRLTTYSSKIKVEEQRMDFDFEHALGGNLACMFFAAEKCTFLFVHRGKNLP